MKLTWLSHDVFLIDGPPRVLIDPFFSGNPKAPAGLTDTLECDFVVLTHAHGDHLGDAVAIAKRTGATLVATHEVAGYCAAQGVARTEGMNSGGTAELADAAGNPLKVTMVPAHHSCTIFDDAGNPQPGGIAVGVIIEAAGRAVYHLGDTALLRDFKTIGEFWDIDAALIPIGDYYTMGLRSATIAAGWIRPKKIIPMHYNTFPAIEQDPHAFALGVKDAYDIPVEVLEPGQSVEV